MLAVLEGPSERRQLFPAARLLSAEHYLHLCVSTKDPGTGKTNVHVTSGFFKAFRYTRTSTGTQRSNLHSAHIPPDELLIIVTHAMCISHPDLDRGLTSLVHMLVMLFLGPAKYTLESALSVAGKRPCTYVGHVHYGCYSRNPNVQQPILGLPCVTFCQIAQYAYESVRNV